VDGGILFGLWVVLVIMLLLIQRTETKKRRGVMVVMVLVSLGILYYVSLRTAWSELVLAFVLALVASFLFWLFVGRYNPVGSSDNIRVLGMDD
jgi:low temperature requirement protein LtrA